MSFIVEGFISISDVSDGAPGVGTTIEFAYTLNAGTKDEVGDPTTPAPGVIWTTFPPTGSIPVNAFWTARREKSGSATIFSAWILLPGAASTSILPFVTTEITGADAPALGSNSWNTQALEAASSFTGRNFTQLKALGYGTVIVINYPDNTGGAVKISGKYVKGDPQWVTSTEFIDGDLFVDGTIAGDKIQANSIAADRIKSDSVITNSIKGGDKTSATDVDNDGFYFDKDGRMSLGGQASTLLFDSSNGLRFTGSGTIKATRIGNGVQPSVTSELLAAGRLSSLTATNHLMTIQNGTGAVARTLTISFASTGRFTPLQSSTTINLPASGGSYETIKVYFKSDGTLTTNSLDSSFIKFLTDNGSGIISAVSMTVSSSTGNIEYPYSIGQTYTYLNFQPDLVVTAPAGTIFYLPGGSILDYGVLIENSSLCVQTGDINCGRRITATSRISTEASLNVGSFSSTGISSGITLLPGITTSSINKTAETYQSEFYNPNGLVGGILTSGSSTSYGTSSDYRLKENVVPMSSSIDRLKELSPSRFNFIADDTVTVDGFLAHEVQDVVPEAVTGTKDGTREQDILDSDDNKTGTETVPDYQGIDQAKLVPLLVGALQEAITRIEQLENP